MQCFLFATISVLLIGFSNSYLTASTVTEKYSAPKFTETNPNKSNDTLIFAHVIFRHADRNIMVQYPNDPFKGEIHWAGGIGALTKKGMMNSYELGQYFRRRYDKLLGDTYSPEKVYVRSTDIDRVIQTAQLVAAGLFVPTEEERWSKELLWQPIPVHTMRIVQDHVVAAHRPCPKYDVLMEKYIQTDSEYRRILRDNASLFTELTDMMGVTFNHTDHIYYLHNTIKIELEHNKPVPSFMKKAYEAMQAIAEFSFTVDSSTPQLARLKHGFLIKEIFEHFVQKINGTLVPNRTLWLYAAHDFTIAGVLNSLGLFVRHIVPHVCSIHFELYETDEDEHYVQLFYRQTITEYPTPLTIPQCGTKCSLTRLFEIYREIIPGDFETECAL